MTPERDPAHEWRIESEQTVHDSPWLRLTIARLRLADGRVIDHRIVRYPQNSVGVLMHDRDADSVLLIWRHRFITGHWGWEIPAGMADPGEAHDDAAIREGLEETGYRAVAPREIVVADPSPGVFDDTFRGFYTDRWQHESEPTDSVGEASEIRWLPVSELRGLMHDGQIFHSQTLLTLALADTRGLIDLGRPRT